MQTTTGSKAMESKDQNKEVALSQQQRDRLHLVQYLRFARKQREAGLAVPAYNIQKESTLHMELRLGRGMTILVKTMAHTTMMLEVELSDTVFDVKKKIQDTDGIPIREQRLIYTGRQLIDDRTLADYDIQKGSQMHLVVWCYLLGGYIHPPNYLSYVDYLRMCAWPPVMGPS